MDYQKINAGILRAIDRHPQDTRAYDDLFSLCRSWEAEDFTMAHDRNEELRRLCAKQLRATDPKQAEKFFEIWRKSLLFDAPHKFDAFMRYIELDRKPEKRFYAPRAHYLKPMVQGFQDVLDGKLRLLTISMPKRAGKSQTGINFVNMLSGRNPDKSTLMEGTGDDLVKSFYSGCLEYLQTPNEYLFYDVFPEARLVQTHADTKIINLKSKARFPTIMCRSIDARQVGLSEATNLLYMDDCVEGREEAKNRQRLDDKWEIISGDIMGRAIEGTPMVFTGTRYSLYDPIGRIQEHAQREGWSWKAIEIPALDLVTDESNYEYEREGKKVFTTAYFREQRELLSAEQFESEFQQQPFEAKGLLFNTLFCSNKRKLHKAVREIDRWLRAHDMCLKSNWQVFPTKARMPNAMGYRYGRGYTLPRKKTMLRFKRACRRVQKRIDQGRDPTFHQACGIISRAGWFVHCNGHHALRTYLTPLGEKRLKDVIRRELRRQAARAA